MQVDFTLWPKKSHPTSGQKRDWKPEMQFYICIFGFQSLKHFFSLLSGFWIIISLAILIQFHQEEICCGYFRVGEFDVDFEFRPWFNLSRTIWKSSSLLIIRLNTADITDRCFFHLWTLQQRLESACNYIFSPPDLFPNRCPVLWSKLWLDIKSKINDAKVF